MTTYKKSNHCLWINILALSVVLLPFSVYAETPCESYQKYGDAITLTRPVLDEISGLAASHSNPKYFYGHTDSGGKPELYVIDKLGNHVYTFVVRGISNKDWEDIAVAPCDPYQKKQCIYIADTGDNTFNRKDKVIHAIEEPSLPDNLQPKETPDTLEVVHSWHIKYPETSATEAKFINPDCESMMVHPVTGEVYIVSKQSSGGVQTLYRMKRGGTDAGLMTALSSWNFSSKMGDLVILYNATTGADFAPNGRRFVIRTYAAFYEYDLIQYPDIAQAFEHPKEILLSNEVQGESVAYGADGKSIWSAGERITQMGITVGPDFNQYLCISNSNYTEPSPISIPNPLPELEPEPGPYLDLLPQPATDPDPVPTPDPDPTPDPNPDPTPNPDQGQTQTPDQPIIPTPNTPTNPADSSSACQVNGLYQTSGHHLPLWMCLFGLMFLYRSLYKKQ